MYRFVEDQMQNEVTSMKTANGNYPSKHHYSHSQDEEHECRELNCPLLPSYKG